MIERIALIVLGIAITALSARAHAEIRSAESERDMWRNLYLIERRSVKNGACEWVDSTHVLCKRVQK